MQGDQAYTLKVRVDHMRRGTMSSLLFSLAQQALRGEQRGEGWEQVHCHLTGDGDYSALAVVDEGSAVAEDDISAADRIRNGEQRDNSEADRQRRIEAFRESERQRLAKLRESK